MCPVDKAANNTAFICKKYYIWKLLSKLVPVSPDQKNTYKIIALRQTQEMKISSIVKNRSKNWWEWKISSYFVFQCAIACSKSANEILKWVKNHEKRTLNKIFLIIVGRCRPTIIRKILFKVLFSWFLTLFQYFICSLWTSNCTLGSSIFPVFSRIRTKSRN